ncbi:tyrosine-type recombinase/integrase [Rathayibacter sp. CAU 1779]
MSPRKRQARRSPSDLGTVRQERSGRFSASYRITDPDTGVTTTYRPPGRRTFDTRAEAAAWLAQERADRARGTWRDPDADRILLRDYAATWIANRADLRPRTLDLYRHTLHRWVLPRVSTDELHGLELGRMPLRAITSAMVATWHGHLVNATRDAGQERAAGRRGRIHPARLWAQANGHAVAPTGKMPARLLQAWKAAGSPTPVPDTDDAGRTVAAQAYRLLHTILATAERDGLIDKNPCQVRGARTVQRRERTILTAAEVEAVAAAIDADTFLGPRPTSLRAAVYLAAWSGLRYGELFALARRHIDLAAGTVRVERALVARAGHTTKFGKPKTAKSQRIVHLPGFVINELRTHMAHHTALGPNALIFTIASTGGPVSGTFVSRRLKTALQAIDRPEVTWHDLRHTGATLAYRTGASQRAVMNRLGHATTAAAMIYAHAAEDADAAIAAGLDTLRSTASADAPVITIGHTA